MIIDKQKLDLALARKGLNSRDLHDSGIPSSVITSIRRGQNIRPKTAGKLAQALNLDVQQILADKKQ